MTVTRFFSPWMGLNSEDQSLISGQVMTTCQLRCQGAPCHHQPHDSDNDLPVTFWHDQLYSSLCSVQKIQRTFKKYKHQTTTLKYENTPLFLVKQCRCTSISLHLSSCSCFHISLRRLTRWWQVWGVKCSQAGERCRDFDRMWRRQKVTQTECGAAT